MVDGITMYSFAYSSEMRLFVLAGDEYNIVYESGLARVDYKTIARSVNVYNCLQSYLVFIIL